MSVNTYVLKGKMRKYGYVNDAISYVKRSYSEHVEIYTDASKSESGKVGIAYVVPELDIVAYKRVSNHISVYTGELLAILR